MQKFAPSLAPVDEDRSQRSLLYASTEGDYSTLPHTIKIHMAESKPVDIPGAASGGHPAADHNSCGGRGHLCSVNTGHSSVGQQQQQQLSRSAGNASASRSLPTVSSVQVLGISAGHHPHASSSSACRSSSLGSSNGTSSASTKSSCQQSPWSAVIAYKGAGGGGGGMRHLATGNPAPPQGRSSSSSAPPARAAGSSGGRKGFMVMSGLV